MARRIPMKITLDAYAASHRAIAELTKGEWRIGKASAHRDQQVLEQHDRTGSSTGEATASSDAGAQESPNRCQGYQWDRVGGENQEGPVQNRQTRRTHGNDAGDLESRLGCVIQNLSF